MKREELKRKYSIYDESMQGKQSISKSDSSISEVDLPSFTTDQVRQWSEGFWVAGHLTQDSAPTVFAVQVEVVEKIVKAGETH